MRSKLYILSFILFFCGNIAIVSAQQQSNYQRFRDRGQALLRQQKCDEALKQFEYAKNSKDCPKKNDIDKLIKQAKNCEKLIDKKPTSTGQNKQLKILFSTDYPCDLSIDHEKQTSLKDGETKEIIIPYKNPKDTFLIVASSGVDNIQFKRKITASDFQSGGKIQIELKNLIPKKEEPKKIEEKKFETEEKIEPEITLEVSLSHLNFKNTGGTMTVKVNTNADNYWIVDSTLPKYCSILKKQNSFFDVKCNSNPDPEDREGWFIVRAGNKEKRIDIKQKASPVYLTISLKDYLFADNSGTETIDIKTNAKDLKINEIDSFKGDWLTVSKIVSGSFKIEYEDNPSVEERMTKYSITAGGIEDTIIIKQKGKPIVNKVYPYNVVFNPKGGTRPISVTTTTGEYTISTPPKWFQTENKDRTGFIVNCNPYTRKEIRYARTDRTLKKNLTRYDTIIVSVKDSIQKISVAQKAPAMALKIPYNTVGFTFGYVQKNWDYQIPNNADTNSSQYDLTWDNKKMHGLQAGIRIEPYFASSIFGLGISSGIYYQYVSSKSDILQNNKKNYQKKMIDHSLSIPIHLIYRYDFTKAVGLFINGGLSIDFSLSLQVDAINESDGSIARTSDNILKKSNWEIVGKTRVTGELGGGIKLGRFIFFIASSVGSSDEKIEESVDTIKIIPRHRMRVGISLMVQ